MTKRRSHSRLLHVLAACAAFSIVGACGGEDKPQPAQPDAGKPDAGQAPVDAGPPDAGPLAPVDSGTPDAGSPHDAAVPADSGAPKDAGVMMPMDAGMMMPMDSGPPDAGHDAGPPLPAWTVLVYMAADNNLEKYAIDDLNEMLAAKTGADVQLVVQMDRASGFYGLGVGGVANWDSMKRFRVREKPLGELCGLAEQVPGDPKVLTDFISWGFTQFPSQHRMLVLWNHGNAWQGYGGDDSAHEDRLDQQELQQAILNGLSSQTKLDLVGFDACLMSTFVTAGALRDRAHYFVASEELEPGNGWDYTDLLNYLSTHTTAPVADLGSAIVEGFYAQARLERKHNDVTIATLDRWSVADCVHTARHHRALLV